ncbi:MAG TPA: Crp/Fnr family transcriptional regulator, partial [Burkholderiales bacterium]
MTAGIPSRHAAAPVSDSFIINLLADLDASAGVAFARRRVKAGETAFHAGDSFNAIYAVRSGFLKIGIVDPIGREQLMGFVMRGELFGLEGIGTGRYDGTATALEDSEIVVLPFALIEDMARRIRRCSASCTPPFPARS